MPGEIDRALLLALAALHEIAGTGSRGPVRPSLSLRALLALVHDRSNGDRAPYEAFWRRCLWPGDGEHGDGYMRATYARTHWLGIVRTLGVEPQSMELHDCITELIAAQWEVGDPEIRAVRRAARALREAKHDREIVATKGHPFTERGRELMAQRIARGEEPA